MKHKSVRVRASARMKKRLHEKAFGWVGVNVRLLVFVGFCFLTEILYSFFMCVDFSFHVPFSFTLLGLLGLLFSCGV